MSTPANPLSRFRSYSYYHVLAICDSTITADALSKQSDADLWRHPITAQQGPDGQDSSFSVLKEFALKFVDITDSLGNPVSKGKYCILINGATDAAFSITRAKWSSYTAAAATVMDQSTSIAVEGEMEISEPKGVVFLDTLVNCCLAMGIDAANAIFVLKTFFIGYPDWKSTDVPLDNASASDSVPAPEDFIINDVTPIQFIAYDVSGNFTESGGVYHISFVSIANGVSRLPQYCKSASGFSFTAGKTLRDTIGVLAGVVERNYNNLFNCVHDTIAKNDAIKEFASQLAPVKYTFFLDDSYDHTYTVSDTQPQNKDKTACEHPSTMHFPANMSIEDALHLIMRSCKKVQSDMSNGRKEDGKIVQMEYKINTAYKSYPGNDKKLIHEVQYLIQPFIRPKDINLFDLAAKADEGSSLEALKRNTITFDYIFTGKNLDILEFDIKLNMGMQYLQVATINNTLKGSLQSSPTAVKQPMKNDQQNFGRFGKVNQVPVFFGTQVRTPTLRNKQSPSETAEAGYTMNKHSSIEVQDVTMKIYGNPRLLSSINRTTSSANLGTTDTFVSDTQGSFYSWGAFPAFAKVNIRMPQNNDDVALFKHDPTTLGVGDDFSFTKEFWFTGLYYVVGIDHMFEVGEFTQTLSMLGIPQSSAVKAINRQGQNQATFDIQKNIASCYDASVDPCAPTGPAPRLKGNVGSFGRTGVTAAPSQNVASQSPQAGTTSSAAQGTHASSVTPIAPKVTTNASQRAATGKTCDDKKAADDKKKKGQDCTQELKATPSTNEPPRTNTTGQP